MPRQHTDRGSQLYCGTTHTSIPRHIVCTMQPLGQKGYDRSALEEYKPSHLAYLLYTSIYCDSWQGTISLNTGIRQHGWSSRPGRHPFSYYPHHTKHLYVWCHMRKEETPRSKEGCTLHAVVITMPLSPLLLRTKSTPTSEF